MLYIQESSLGAVTSLYLLCCILRIVKIKDLANTVAAALLCCPETITNDAEANLNGNILGHDSSAAASQQTDENNFISESNVGSLRVAIPTSDSSEYQTQNGVFCHDCGGTQKAPR